MALEHFCRSYHLEVPNSEYFPIGGTFTCDVYDEYGDTKREYKILDIIDEVTIEIELISWRLIQQTNV